MTSDLKQSAKSVFSSEKTSFGTGFIWSIYFICMFDYPLFQFTTPQSSANNMFNMTMLISLSVMLVVSGLIGFFGKHLPMSARSSRTAITVGGVCLALGIIIGVTTSYVPISNTVLYVTGGILAGLGFDLLLISWMSCFCSSVVGSARLHIPLSFGFGALVAFITLFLPNLVALVLVIVLILICCRCMVFILESGANSHSEIASYGSMSALSTESGAVSGGLDEVGSMSDISREAEFLGHGDIIGYGICTIVLSLIYTLVGQVALAAPTGYDIINRLTVFMVFVAGLLAFALESLFKKRADFRIVYKIVFAIIATGLFFLPFLGEGYWIVFNALVVLSFYLFYIRFNLLISSIYKGRTSKGSSVFALYSGLIFGFSLVGVLIGSVFTKSGELNAASLLSVAFSAVYLLALGFMPLVKRNKEMMRIDIEDADWDETKKAVTYRMERLRSSADAALDRPLWSFSDSELANLCDRFSAHYKLTGREREILPYIIKGKSSFEISNSLVLSQSTVKGHMRTLYRKCDVHSKTELISLVEKDRIGW